MQYMLLIYVPEESAATPSDEDGRAIYEEYVELSRDMRSRNAYLDGNELDTTANATSVRVREGDVQVTDGPFAETKEVLGGYYLIEAESLDEAIEWAARVPSARRGTIEVRPVVLQQAEVPA